MPYKPKYPPKKTSQKGTGRGRKKKQIEPIRGVGSTPEQSMVVQKSLPLFSLWRSPLSLAEFKILDTYLARIDSHDEEHRVVIFQKGEIEKLLGVKQIHIRDLKPRLKNLMETSVDISDKSARKGFHLLSLFEEAIAEQDDDGQWIVRMECTEKARDYIFNVDNIGYLRYALRNVVNLSSRYSYILFCYLEQQRWRHHSEPWEVPVDELKTILNCPDTDAYQEYWRFNDHILKKCHKELNEKTNCRFSYTPVKSGRSVKAIRFTLASRSAILEETIVQQMQEEQLLLAEYTMQPTPDEKWLILAQKACTPEGAAGSEFDSDRLTTLWHLACCLPDSAIYHTRGSSDPMEYCADALRYYYLLMNQYKPRNRFAYLSKLLQDKINNPPVSAGHAPSVLDQAAAGTEVSQSQMDDILWLQKFMAKHYGAGKKEGQADV